MAELEHLPPHFPILQAVYAAAAGIEAPAMVIELPASVHDLTDDLVLHVMVQASFPTLVCLKSVCRSYCSFARRALSGSDAPGDPFFRARLASHCTDRKDQAARFADFIWMDDVKTVEAMLVLELFAASTPVFSTYPLHFADSREMVALLMECSANVNARRTNGRTALMDACSRGSADVARALCEYGADVNLKDALGGVGALHYAEVCCKKGPPLDVHVWMSTVCGGCPAKSRTVDGAACVQLLHEFGVAQARCSREEWWHASVESPDEIPDEYQVTLH